MYFKKQKQVSIKVIDEKAIKRLGLNLIHAVGGYSANKPKLVILDYKPRNYKKTICLAGKGVTIDTGGYSVKDVRSMNNMHMDKEGACISMGIFDNLVKQNSKNRIVCLCPLVENIVSNASSKPKDVVKAYNGQTVEIVNVDAEGRLILADTLAYISKNYKPDYIFDIATLTSASDAYCHTSFSYFTVNEKLSSIATSKCKDVGEKIIRIPPWVEYMEYIKSNIADVKNSGYKCKRGDDFMASLFLMNFIDKKYRNKWMHFDIRMMSDNNELNIAEGFGTILKIINNI
jgi:leucyl aminopeptidase